MSTESSSSMALLPVSYSTRVRSFSRQQTDNLRSFPKWQSSIRKFYHLSPISMVHANLLLQNEQIDIALNSFLKSRPMANPSKKLSSEGQALVADFRSVVEQAKYMLLTKNEGNVLQDFIWESQKISGGDARLPGAPVDKDTAKQHGNEALEGLRTLGTLIISNGQFRKLCKSPTIVIEMSILTCCSERCYYPHSRYRR